VPLFERQYLTGSFYLAPLRCLRRRAEPHRRRGHHHNTDLDAYGTTNPAEFFAVVTETFFENPVQLKQRHPRLYEQLALFFRQDPATRFVEMGATDSRRLKK